LAQGKVPRRTLRWYWSNNWARGDHIKHWKVPRGSWINDWVLRFRMNFLTRVLLVASECGSSLFDWKGLVSLSSDRIIVRDMWSNLNADVWQYNWHVFDVWIFNCDKKGSIVIVLEFCALSVYLDGNYGEIERRVDWDTNGTCRLRRPFGFALPPPPWSLSVRPIKVLLQICTPTFESVQCIRRMQYVYDVCCCPFQIFNSTSRKMRKYFWGEQKRWPFNVWDTQRVVRRTKNHRQHRTRIDRTDRTISDVEMLQSYDKISIRQEIRIEVTLFLVVLCRQKATNVAEDKYSLSINALPWHACHCLIQFKNSLVIF
jgi:hypothetical protein